MRITYPTVFGKAREIEVTDDALIERNGRDRAEWRLPLAEITRIRYLVGRSKGTTNDTISLGVGIREISIESWQADPAGHTESRARYRKFVRLVLKRVAAAGAQPRIAVPGGVPRGVSGVVVAVGLLGLLLVLHLLIAPAAPIDAASLAVCFFPSLLVFGWGVVLWRRPTQFIDLDTARDWAVPPADAD